MQRISLDIIETFITNAKYPISSESPLLSRCIDGRYDNSPHLEPLAKPGADVGDLMMMFATNNAYGLLLEREQIVEAFLETIGDWKNFRDHSDEYHKDSDRILGDGYFQHAFNDPEAFDLQKEDMDFIHKLLIKHQSQYPFIILEGDHQEKAVFIVKGDSYSLYPKINSPFFEAFIYHKTLDNKRRRLLAKNLLKKIDVLKEITEEYLYEIMSTQADNQFLAIISLIAKDLPMYEVTFDDNGQFEVIET